MIDRRKFVTGVGAAVAAATLPAQVWVSPFDIDEGLPLGQVVYETFTRANGSRISYASAINGRYLISNAWHYDLHGIGEKPASPGQPNGPSCQPGEVVEL